MQLAKFVGCRLCHRLNRRAAVGAGHYGGVAHGQLAERNVGCDRRIPGCADVDHKRSMSARRNLVAHKRRFGGLRVERGENGNRFGSHRDLVLSLRQCGT